METYNLVIVRNMKRFKRNISAVIVANEFDCIAFLKHPLR